MNDFHKALSYVNKILYEPNQLIVKSIEEEKQNSKYGAGTFQLSSKTARFRVAKKTPTKIGQFVVFWEKDENNNNQPFLYENAPDLLIITTFKNSSEFGQFIFPKKILYKKNILKSIDTKGKMGLRVYPSWDTPISKVAIETQKWQLAYFIDIGNTDKSLIKEMLESNSLLS